MHKILVKHAPRHNASKKKKLEAKQAQQTAQQTALAAKPAMPGQTTAAAKKPSIFTK